MSYKFCRTLGLKISPLSYPIRVSTPLVEMLGSRISVRLSYWGVAGHEFMFDLILLIMTEFDVIIEMNLLTHSGLTLTAITERLSFKPQRMILLKL